MKPSEPLIVLAIVAVALLITVVWMVVPYNSLVSAGQSVEAQWDQVEN